jgi:formate dehydrogenase subunit delta
VDVEHLIQMANQIGQFHASLPDHAAAVSGTASHIRRFWDPRMRRALLAHVDQHHGEGLDPLVLEAINGNRAMIEPPARTSPTLPS